MALRDAGEPYQALPRFPASWIGELGGPAPEQTSSPSTAPAPTTGIKASLVLAALEWLRATDTEALERVMGRLPPDAVARLTGVLLPMAWVELADYVELLRGAERAVGRGDGSLAIRIGRASADVEIATTHRSFMQTATPTTAVERIPQIFWMYHSSGRAKVQRTTTGGYRVETDDIVPDTLPHALALSGFYQRMVELAGGQKVRASVVACRERGDEGTITVLRWR